MQRHLGLAVAVALLGAAACSKSDAPDNSLSHDLELAGSTNGLALAPSSGRTDVVSAVERSPEARPAVKPSSPERRAVYHRPQQAAMATVASVPEPVPVPVPVPVAVTPEPAPAAVTPTVDPTPSPRPTPTRQTAPRGGYKSEAEVFRNAPFPILP